jgi:hypothetical protein
MAQTLNARQYQWLKKFIQKIINETWPVGEEDPLSSEDAATEICEFFEMMGLLEVEPSPEAQNVQD